MQASNAVGPRCCGSKIQEEKVISSPTSQTRKADKDQDENREEEVKATTGTRRCKSTDVALTNTHLLGGRQMMAVNQVKAAIRNWQLETPADLLISVRPRRSAAKPGMML